jgi:hypothetical protein
MNSLETQMMITRNQIERALRFAKPVFIEQFGSEQSDDLLAAMEAIYRDLEPSAPRLTNEKNQMLLRIAVDAVALYRVLPAGMPPGEKLAMVQAFVNNWMDGQFERWIARKVWSTPLLHRLYRWWWFRSSNKADEPDGQRFEMVKRCDNLFYGFNVTRCGLVKYLNREGEPELGPVICRGDEHVEKYLPQNVEFKRTQVIAEGAAYCDFRYYFTDSDSQS